MPHNTPEKRRKYIETYYEKNRDKRNAYSREYYRNHGRKAYARSAITFRYGLTLDEYASLEEDQDWACAICKRGADEGVRLNLDHNHTTKKARAFLCHRCNIAIGVLESPHFLGYQQYLEKHA